MTDSMHTLTIPARRVLVFDPHQLCRELLVSSVSAHGFEARGAGSPREAWAQLSSFDPDAVIMEVNINSCESGIAFADLLLDRSPGMGMVFLTDVRHPRLIDPGCHEIPEGAAYLHKAEADGLGQVLMALEGVLHGVAEVPRHDRDFAAAWDSLSSQQIEVLRLIADGYSNKEIAQIRGTQVRSVEALIGRTFDQLNIDAPGGEGNRRVLAARYFLLACLPRETQAKTQVA